MKRSFCSAERRYREYSYIYEKLVATFIYVHSTQCRQLNLLQKANAILAEEVVMSHLSDLIIERSLAYCEGCYITLN